MTDASHEDIPPQVRKAVAADIPRIFEIRFAVKENILSDPGKVTVDDTLWFIAHSTIWVWKEDGQIRGFSAADPRDGTIWALFVDPAYEGRGIGQALIALACSTLRQSGHRTASLGTEAGTRAEEFYRKNGWTDRGHKPSWEILFQRDLY